MKKIKSIFLGLITTFAMTLTVNAAGNINLSSYASEDLNATFTEENITSSHMANYNPTNVSVPIYVFRGTGCGYCKYFYQYVADELLATHGDKINIISFEIRNNASNWNLAQKIQEYRGEYGNTGSIGTPYIVIGDKSFTGNISSKKAEIEATIDLLYNDSNRYDIIDDMNNNQKKFTDNNVTFISSKGINKNYTLSVNQIDKTNVILTGYDYIDAYDITMYDGTNIVTLPKGNYTIRIPIQKKYDIYEIAYIENNQIVEKIKPIYENGEIVFTTNHLSEYAIFGKNNTDIGNTVEGSNSTNSNENKAPNNAQTSSMNIVLYLVLVIGSLIGMIYIFTSNKKEIA